MHQAVVPRLSSMAPLGEGIVCAYLSWSTLAVKLDRLPRKPGVIPRSEKEGTKPPYVCPGCSNHTHGNNMINRCNVVNKRVIFLT
jgi:hypothetical protein